MKTAIQVFLLYFLCFVVGVICGLLGYTVLAYLIGIIIGCIIVRKVL